ncbi:MAG: hypothetical protein Q9157_003404 [Trypethelium eluteriae]
MPFARSPVLQRSESSQKKQQSISSFFAPKATATPKTRLDQDSKTATPSKATDSAQLNANHQGNALFVHSDDEDVPREPGLRRLKRSSEEASNNLRDEELSLKRHKQMRDRHEVIEDDNENDIHGALERRDRMSLVQASATELNGRQKLKLSERTSKYMFSSSPARDENEPEPDDEESRRTKESLHRKFVKKLGKPDSIADIKRRNNFITEETAEGDEDAEEEDNEGNEPAAKPMTRGKKGPALKKGGKKLTPMEQQIMDLKRKYMDTLLVVEVGYKFRFFGEDARVAAKELGIVCIPGKFRFDEHPSEAHIDRFASASFPVHRLHVHVKRLVNAGHKVGVVRQTETAALKAVGDNRNTPFTRKVTNLYTKGTYIDDVEGLEEQPVKTSGKTPATGYLLCLTESKAKGWGSDEKVHVGLVAVQPSVGDVIYDDFEDGFMRSEIETRLLHIAPCEILLVGELSKATEKLVKHLSGTKANVFGDRVRLDRVNKPKTMAASAYSQVSGFYADKMKSSEQSSSQDGKASTFLDKVHNLSEHVTICLSAMITHLTDYGLEHVLDLTKYFQSFSTRSHMLLNGNTLTSLELYHNQTDHTEKGSLFWTLDRTQTRFGQRLLRKWVGRPLLDKSKLEERIAAVEELKGSERTAAVDKLRHVLGKIKGDLEKTLIRIYYKKCTRAELLTMLQTLQRTASEYVHVKSASDAGFASDIINNAFASLPSVFEDVVNYLERINAQAAKDDDKYAFFREEHESEMITAHKLGIASVEHDLDEHRRVAAEKLRKKSVEYVRVAQIEYLIEVDNTQLKNVPASWVKISGTKKVSRFHTPEVITLMRERDQHKESLAAACDTAFVDLLSEIGSKYQSFRDCIQSLAVLDCLLSLAEVANQPGYVKPEFTDETCISVSEGRHPMVEQLLLDAYVPNDIELKADATRALLITGPNMGGKSSYVRQVALIAIMGQIGSYVPAASAKLGMLDAVFTRMGAFDNMLAGESTFMVELHETADILKQASPRSLVILDELGRGTSTHDGVAIAQAVLDYIVGELKSLTLFITHYQSLAAMARSFNEELKNVHMRFKEERGTNGQEDVTFLYEVGEGVAHRSYGLNVARLAHVPNGVLDVASVKSKEMEIDIGRKKLSNLARIMTRSFEEAASVDLDQLLNSIEQI